MKVMQEPAIHVVKDSEPWSVIRCIVESGAQEDPFYVLDLGEVVARYRRWRELMPRVEPFYAVKCNDDKLLVSTLAALGTGFDCASKAEIELVTSLGVRPERIIYANPVKMLSHLKYGKVVGVTTMTFDNENELMKIKEHAPDADLVIRIRCDAENVTNPLGVKFGCNPDTETPRLLKIAAVLQLNVVGVSFHIGTDAQDFAAYGRAIKLARSVFEQGFKLGHKRMTMLDIGGGFPGTKDNGFEKVASIVNHALATYFPEGDIKVIGEPGRYFAQATTTLAVMVYGKKEVFSNDDINSDKHTMYFVNDGVYGMFSNVISYKETYTMIPLKPRNILDPDVSCSIWGPSCDGIDCIVPSTRMPSLAEGDWLITEDMGAYTTTTSTSFNGFTGPKGYAVIDSRIWPTLKNLFIEGGYCYNFTTLNPSPRHRSL